MGKIVPLPKPILITRSINSLCRLVGAKRYKARKDLKWTGEIFQVLTILSANCRENYFMTLCDRELSSHQVLKASIKCLVEFVDLFAYAFISSWFKLACLKTLNRSPLIFFQQNVVSLVLHSLMAVFSRLAKKSINHSLAGRIKSGYNIFPHS